MADSESPTKKGIDIFNIIDCVAVVPICSIWAKQSINVQNDLLTPYRLEGRLGREELTARRNTLNTSGDGHVIVGKRVYVELLNGEWKCLRTLLLPVP